MTPEYIAACWKAKEEGWLPWKPTFGDWCSYRGFLSLVTIIDEQKGEVYLTSKSTYIHGWYSIKDCTWLPTMEQLMEILRRASSGVLEWVKGTPSVDIDVQKIIGGEWETIVDDLSLALLKAVEAVRRKV